MSCHIIFLFIFVAMKRLVFVLLVVVTAMLTAAGQVLVDAWSRMALAPMPAMRPVVTASPPMIQATLEVDAQQAVDSLRAIGAYVNGHFGKFITVTVSRAKMETLLKLPHLKSVALARTLTLTNDSARRVSYVDQVHQGDGSVLPRTGRGVVIGMIDSGFDFNHINFRDSAGHSRICAVYLPDASSGTVPVIDGDTLPGRCYETVEEIAALTTDEPSLSHGTHTTGTAAGSYQGNGLWGMAPEAEIVACGMRDTSLTDINVAHSARYIMDYARRHGKPCVINMSLGDSYGPHDGSSWLCQVLDSLAGPGRIIVLSAGNDGGQQVFFTGQAQNDGDTVRTLLRNKWGGNHQVGEMSVWSDGPSPHEARIAIIDIKTGQNLYTSPYLSSVPSDSVWSLDSGNDTTLGKCYSGWMRAVHTLESNGRYHSYWDFDMQALSSQYAIALQLTSATPTVFTGWTGDYNCFQSKGLAGYENGDSGHSISDLATGDNTISVGAYAAKDTMLTCTGEIVTFKSVLQQIAPWSSYGPDLRGISRPDVTAPGLAVVSSVNRYDTLMMSNQNLLAPWVETADGERYPYTYYRGTSMSTPVVAGAVAMWLEAAPDMTPGDVRQVLAQTSRRDYWVTSGNPERWGSGKLDALAGLKYVTSHFAALPGDVNCDDVVTVADANAVVRYILTGGEGFSDDIKARADVNNDGVVNVADASAIIAIILAYM